MQNFLTFQKQKKIAKILTDYLKSLLWRHKWKYYNPYDRECTICGRQEVEHMLRENLPNLLAHGWWEVYDDGDETKHYWWKRER